MKPSGHDRPGGEKFYQRIVTAKFRLELVISSIEENGIPVHLRAAHTSRSWRLVTGVSVGGAV